MNRTFGSSAGVIALLFFVLHIAVPSGQEGGGGGQPAPPPTAGGKGAAQTPPAANAGNTPEVAPEGPWLATQHFFASTPNPDTPVRFGAEIDVNDTQDIINCSFDTSCAPMLAAYFGAGDKEGGRIEFLLATVPDPLHTRLSLFTDSTLDAIQKAATDDGWFFATQWLPWNDTVDPDEKDPAKRSEDRDFIRTREQQPGVLVFRRKIGDPGVLVVFVLGETPTAGINPEQFQIARAYMRAIHEPGQIRIQGPIFSGALYSLDKLIEEDKKCTTAEYLVRGTASDLYEGLKLKQYFASTTSLGTFGDVLDALKISPTEAALLVEDETGYGESVARGNESIRTFRFPRDISHLRNAYREVAQASSQNGAPTPDLDFSIKDADIGEDSIPTFSKTQSPLLQSAVLNEITGAIQRNRIRIVQITATNVLDRLFLARVLKRQCPDTRLVISFPDLLFVEAAQTDALTGTLAVSNYPIFMASNDWSGRQREQPFTFPDANAEGVYNATMLLLTAGRPESERASKLADYHWNSARQPLPHPPLWLLALDREGFAPVRLLTQTPGKDLFESVADTARTSLALPRPSALWRLFSAVAASISLLWLGLTICLRLTPRLKTGAGFAVEAMDDASDRQRLFCLSLLALAVTVIQAVICFPIWLNPHDSHIFPIWVLPLSGMLAALSCGILAIRSANNNSPNGCVRSAIALAASFVILILWLLCCYGQGEQSFFFSYRAAELRIGASPMGPVLAALCVLLLFAWLHLTRLYLAVYEKPEVVVDKIQTALQPKIEESYNNFNKSVESPLGVCWEKPSWKDPQWVKAAVSIAAAIIFFFAARLDVQLSSIDGSVYNILSIALMLAATAALLLACWHVMTLWHQLEGLLSCLNTLPIKRAFIRPDHSRSTRPIWVRRLNLQSIDIHAHAMTVLHDMILLRPAWAGWLKPYVEQIEKLVAAEPQTRLEAFETRQDIRRISKAIATQAFMAAREFWVSSSLVEHFEPQTVPNEEQQTGRRGALLEIDGDPKSIGDLAETFVALHYSSFLIYGVRQIRNLMLFLSAGFVLLVVSMNSYNHQAPQFIGRFLLVLFILIGAAMWTCLTGMERDPILSRIAGTTPGKLNMESYLKVLGYGALPVLGLLASQFPAISNFLYSWIAPTLKAVH